MIQILADSWAALAYGFMAAIVIAATGLIISK